MNTNRQCSFSNRPSMKTNDSVATLINNLVTLTDSLGTLLDNVATLIDSLGTLLDS